MNRKIRILVLFLMLALFTGSQVYAQDQDGSLPAPKEEKILTESSFQEKPLTAQAREEVKNSEGGQGKEEANLPQYQAKEEPVAQTGEKTGQEDPQKENPDPKSPAREPQDLESAAPTSPAQAKSPASTGETDGQNATQPSEKPKEGQEGTGEKPKDNNDNKEKPQVDPKEDKDLSDLQEQIDKANAAKDTKTEAALQKEYNEKLFKKIEETGADKFNKEVLKRFTDKARTDKFYKLQAEYEVLKKKAEKGTLTKTEVDNFNKKVGSFTPPRKLDSDEESAQKKLSDSVDVPELQAGATEDAKAKLEAYKKAKEALKNALDSEEARNTSKEELKKLLDEFEAAEKALKDGIKDGSIKPTYTDGTPTVRVFPLTNGSVGTELTNDPEKDAPYYIPDNTSIELLVHVNKDEEPKDFTFTIKAIGEGVDDPNGQASNLAFLNGTPVDLVKNNDGSYSFTVSSANMNFGIAQLRFNIPGFEGPFHKGFDLVMDLGNGNTVTKQFRITKKGYEDDAKIDGPGSDKDDDPTKIPEIDAGKTENAVVDEETDKVHDFFTYLKKSNTYIDEVTFNSGNGQSLPLDSVDITITVPKSGENNFAKMIYKSGLKYHSLGNGKYQLKLDRKVFGGNLTEKGGKFYLKGENGQADKELTAATLKDVILENTGKKVYVDKDGNAHDIITSEVLTDKNGDYKVENGKLYKKNAEDQSKFDEIGTFDKTGKIEKEGKTYILKDGKLISYTKEYDVFEGNVANKDGKADPDVTPTYKGKQVTIETTKDGKTETSYGGTIVEDAIYDKNGKIFNEEGYERKAGTVLIGPDGKVVDGINYDSKDIKEDKNTGVKIVTVDGVLYHIVENPVFKNGYIIDGLEYKEGLSLIDKFGKKMNVKVTEEKGTYTFTKILKDKEGNEIEDEDKVESGKKDKRNVIVGTAKNQILVNNKNEVVNDPEDKYTKIGPKYYYNGKEFVKADGDGLQGNKFFEDSKEFILTKTTTHSYMDGKELKEIDNFGDKKVYEGSLEQKDYFEANGKIYVKKSQGEYYVSADPEKSNEILSEKKIAKIVQTLGEGNKAIEKVTDETDIFDAVQNAKFALRFPGFLAGKNIVYNVHADVKATYKEPSKTEEGKFEEKSIFKDDSTQNEKDKTKKIDKFFTLKNEKTTKTEFFKNAPEALKKTPDYHFFNIFYRDLTDTDRDNLITDLLKTKAEEDKKREAEATPKADGKEEEKKELSEEEKKAQEEIKAKLALLESLQKELGRLYDGATFDIATDKEGKNTLVIKDKDGNVIEADELNKMRSLLWEVGFKNEEGNLFPENPDTEIIIEDHNMDNRLIYDEIIVNDTRKNWDKLNKAHEDAKKQVAEAEKALADNTDASQKERLEKALDEAKKALENAKFKGTKDYFFLDQIKDIRFGVNPNYINGRFVPLGKDFCITGDEIIEKLGEGKEEVTITKGGIDFKITRDKANGQVRIKVMNAFYAKAKEGSKNKFESPVQKVYQDKITNLYNEVDKLSEKTTEKDIEEFVKTLHAEESECFGIIKQKLTEEFEKVKDNSKELEKFKADLKTEIKKIKLEYLDKSKHKENDKSVYKYDDMRFNAIRIGLKPNITIGGAMNPQNTKKLGITSVIIPEIDIPYTDEFGNLLTNKDMYVKAEIEKILKEGIAQGEGKAPKKYTEDDLKNEEKFREIMAEAYKRVNENNKIEIKDLVMIEEGNENKVGMEKYTAKNGSDFKLGDLAVDGKVLTNKEGFAINPWYIVKGKETKSVEEIFKEKFGAGYDKMPEYLELEKMHIDIAAYYMSKQGYDRNKYANQANYKLSGGDKKDGLFGSDSDWHKKICYPGIGHCIEQAGKDSKAGENPEAGKFGAEEEKGADFELTYEPTNKGPEKEEPKVDKKTEEKDKSVDITGDEDKKVNFKIDVTVDKMTKKQKDIADALTPEAPKKSKEDMTEEEKKAAEAEKEAKKIEAGNYNKETGYYEYKNSLIIDFLPEIFKLKQGETKLTFTPYKDKLMANDANADFKDEKAFENWKNGIEYFYTDDLEAYAKTLTDKEKAAVLKKAIEDAKASGKIKEGQKVQAVLAWVPTFEAPHGSKEQFKFELTNVYVDKKKYKDFVDNVIGTNYTNHAAFGDKARFYFGETTVNIYEQHEGKVNKYLQLLDKEGKPIDADKAEGWFKGNAELKFGDKFNYRIEYKNNQNIVPVPGEAHSKSEIKIEDLFASVDKKGLRPVLNGYITSDFEFENQVKVIYKIEKDGQIKEYTKEELKEAIKANKAKFSDVTSVVLEGKYENGATHKFDLPMMIPELDAKIKDGKVVYIGTDGKEHELGDADKFFNLKSLVDPSAEMAFKNKVKDSNTVTVYLEKNRFIRLFKEFFDANGEEIKKDRPEMKFDIYQYQTDKDGNPIKDENGNIIKVKVLDKDGKPLQLVVNEKNNFTDMKSNLPLFKKTISFGKDGKAIETVTNYKYELVENNASGYDVKFEVLDNGEDQLGFVIKAKNTEKPERPPHNPPEEPETPPETPPEEPETPPETPPERPEKPDYPQDNPPHSPNKPWGPNNLPKTGLVEDLGLVYLSGLALVGLVLLRKRYFLD